MTRPKLKLFETEKNRRKFWCMFSSVDEETRKMIEGAFDSLLDLVGDLVVEARNTLFEVMAATNPTERKT